MDKNRVLVEKGQLMVNKKENPVLCMQNVFRITWNYHPKVCDIVGINANILFFGNFHKMKLHDFELAFQSLIRDNEYVSSSMAGDLYFPGKVRNVKYRILKLTYGVFMIGMILSVIAISIVFKYLGP